MINELKELDKQIERNRKRKKTNNNNKSNIPELEGGIQNKVCEYCMILINIYSMYYYIVILTLYVILNV